MRAPPTTSPQLGTARGQEPDDFPLCDFYGNGSQHVALNRHIFGYISGGSTSPEPLEEGAHAKATGPLRHCLSGPYAIYAVIQPCVTFK